MRTNLLVALMAVLGAASMAAPARVVVAGKRLGPVPLGSSQSAVVRELGRPVAHRDHWLLFGRRVISPVSPFEGEFMALLESGRVVTLRTYDRRYRTPQGVGPGSTRLDLRHRYRTALRTLVSTDSLDTLWVHLPSGTVTFYVARPKDVVLAVEISK